MANRIPKKAQRQIEQLLKQRAENPIAPLSTPTRMELGVTSWLTCKMFDVYFNGEKQTECVIADSQAGYIVRKRKNFEGHRLLFANERLYGRVEIRRKSEGKQDRVKRQDNAGAGSPCGVPKAFDSGTAERVPQCQAGIETAEKE